MPINSFAFATKTKIVSHNLAECPFHKVAISLNFAMPLLMMSFRAQAHGRFFQL